MEDAQQKPREARKTTLYVGNVPAEATEDLIWAVFGTMGTIKRCNLVSETSSTAATNSDDSNSSPASPSTTPIPDPYCFVEYEDRESAEAALAALNKRIFMGKELKVNWASQTVTAPTGNSKYSHIFVGDLSPDVELSSLREAFAPFGEIADCRVVRDPHSQKSKGYGFVSFVKKSDAEAAIQHMNGAYLGSKSIRTNWAVRKAPTGKGDGVNGHKPLSFEEVFNQSSPTNCTVYIGGVTQGLSHELMEREFAHFGPIQEIRVFKEKGYAFIRFQSKDTATQAILSKHNTEISGQVVKCSWGKESTENAALVSAQIPYAYAAAAAAAAQQLAAPASYWYNPLTTAAFPQFPTNAATAAAAAAGQILQAYPYSQLGYQQGYAATLGLQGQLAQAGWQPSLSTASQSPISLAAAAHGLQQQSMLSAYPLQQFQAQ